MRIVLINLEWNNYNGFMLDILNIEAGIKNGSLFGVNLDTSFCYVDLLFFNIKLWQRVES